MTSFPDFEPVVRSKGFSESIIKENRDDVYALDSGTTAAFTYSFNLSGEESNGQDVNDLAGGAV